MTAVPTENPRNQLTRRITPHDADAVAKLVAKGLTETLAVAKLEVFTIKQWFNWKSKQKNAQKFTDLLARVKAARVNVLLDEIEAASHGDKERGIRHDWRAADRLLGITEPSLAPQAQAGTVTTQTAITVNCGGEDGLRKLVEDTCAQVARLKAGQQTKQLTEPVIET